MKKIILGLIMLFFSVQIFAGELKIRVTESTPIYKKSLVDIPYTEYKEEQVQVPYNCGTRDTNSIGVDTIIGAVIGVAIGNQIGGGNGRDVAKVIGGIAGAGVANNSRDSKTCYRMEFRSRPVTSYKTRTEERLVAYRNCGKVNGRKICIRSKQEQNYIYMQY